MATTKQRIVAFFGCVFYLGGCFLGDGTDAPFDIEHHPERPIPQGILSAHAVSIAGYLCISLAWLASCLTPAITILVVNDVPMSMVVDAVKHGAILSILALPQNLWVAGCCRRAELLRRRDRWK